MKNEQITNKKVKVLGKKRFIDEITGEIEEFDVMSVEERDFNFTKVWLRNFISTLEIVGNKKMAICMWIIENLDNENKLSYTQRQIAEKANASLYTVMQTMNALQNCDFLRKRNSGCYIINPNVLFKGSHNNRLNALTIYKDAEKKEITASPEEIIANYKNTIKTCQKIIQDTEKKLTEMENHKK